MAAAKKQDSKVITFEDETGIAIRINPDDCYLIGSRVYNKYTDKFLFYVPLVDFEAFIAQHFS
ncbi:MAG: hypothetical protein EOM68_00005 [Spirochaetia bacterium]|nr:hypothetical protein [Spirochaetia bacterium]